MASEHVPDRSSASAPATIVPEINRFQEVTVGAAGQGLSLASPSLLLFAIFDYISAHALSAFWLCVCGCFGGRVLPDSGSVSSLPKDPLGLG